jgi:hypothetical protein
MIEPVTFAAVAVMIKGVVCVFAFVALGLPANLRRPVTE